MLEHGAKADAVDRRGRTPLSYAITATAGAGHDAAGFLRALIGLGCSLGQGDGPAREVNRAAAKGRIDQLRVCRWGGGTPEVRRILIDFSKSQIQGVVGP